MKKTSLYRALIIIGLSVVSVSLFAYAQGAVQTVNDATKNVDSIITTFNQTVVRSVAALFMALATIAFFWGIAQYVWGVRNGDKDKVTSGNKFMVNGIIALFVMFSIWGIITFAQSILLQGQNTSTIVIPDIQIQGSSGSRQPSTSDTSVQPAPGSQAPGSNTSSLPTSCSGRPAGTACNPGGGRTGTCSVNDETGSFGCHVTPTGGTNNGCPPGQIMGRSGCYAENSFE